MAAPTHQRHIQMPDHLLAPMESGELTIQQLEEITHVRAAQLGLTFDEAVRLAKRNELPKNPAGSDLQFRILILLSQ